MEVIQWPQKFDKYNHKIDNFSNNKNTGLIDMKMTSSLSTFSNAPLNQSSVAPYNNKNHRHENNSTIRCKSKKMSLKFSTKRGV